MAIEYVVPPSMLEGLQWAPLEQPVALLLRHSVRKEIPKGETGFTLPITAAGRQIAVELGRHIGHHLQSLHTSPVPRCVQTAEAIMDGSQQEHSIQQDTMLGHPGAFIANPQQAWESFCRLGNAEVFYALIRGEHLAGFHNPATTTHRLLQHIMEKVKTPGLHIFVTHDNLVFTTWAICQQPPDPTPYWPLFLEGLFVTIDHIWYRGQIHHRGCDTTPAKKHHERDKASR